MSRKLRVVVADDAFNWATMLARVIDEGGHEVVGMANNGREAIALCNEHKPDLALIDIAMPFMDGEVAVAEILKQQNPPKIIFVTNQGRNTTHDRANKIGAGMVVKPYDPVRIYSEIKRICG